MIFDAVIPGDRFAQHFEAFRGRTFAVKAGRHEEQGFGPRDAGLLKGFEDGREENPVRHGPGDIAYEDACAFFPAHNSLERWARGGVFQEVCDVFGRVVERRSAPDLKGTDQTISRQIDI
jgi:hypothetical protein